MKTMANKTKKARVGRPSLGARGENVSEYPQVMIRLPHRTKAVLEALSAVTGTPIWRLVDQAVDVYVRQLPLAEQKLISGVQSRRAESKPQES
jgi:hypothetical protein